MLRSVSSFGLSVSTQLLIIVGALTTLLLSLALTTQRFSGDVSRAITEGVMGRQLLIDASSLWIICFVAGGVALLLLCPLAVVVVRRFAVRLEDITDKMLRISRNDVDVQITHLHDEDELGDLSRALQVFKANAVSLLGQQELIEQLNLRFEAALNNMVRGLTMFDADKNLVVCNEQFRKIYDLSKDNCYAGVSLHDLLVERASRENLSPEERDKYVAKWFAVHSDMMGRRKRAELEFLMSNGRMILITYEPMSDGGCVAIHEDITDKRRKDEKINRLARRDSLTGVANRYCFCEQLDRQIELCAQGEGFAVHLIDLDHFKDVNDTLGHAVGDVLLRLAAARIKKSMRKGDFVARLGGDEFAVIQTGIGKMGVESETNALAAANRLIEILSSPFHIQGQSILIGASIGVVTGACNFNSCDEVIKRADIALYRAKDEGRGVAVLFRQELKTSIRTRRALELDLRQAIRDGQLELFYQPIVGVDGSRIVSCEALMRWKDPLRGWVAPCDFIPVAEGLGLIGYLGEWALRKACLEASTWPDDVKVSVNLSPLQFQTSDLVEVTRSALEDAGLAANRLELEVTESLLLKDDPETIATMHALRSIGVNFSLDDFGTGYASLSYLLAFPFDKIKIDQMFVRDMIDRHQHAAIVAAIVILAQKLEIRTVAEGVETSSQLHEVIRLGCDEVQGYLFSKPVCEKDIGVLISKGVSGEVVAA